MMSKTMTTSKDKSSFTSLTNATSSMTKTTTSANNNINNTTKQTITDTLTPQAKRCKTLDMPNLLDKQEQGTLLPFDYPQHIPVPSRTMIAMFYRLALEGTQDGQGQGQGQEQGQGQVAVAERREEEISMTTATQITEDSALVISSDRDQEYLNPAGLLSFEQVLLPAIARQEDLALKALQSKVQRDHPEWTYVVRDCRVQVYQMIHAAMEAVKKNRHRRLQQVMERRQAKAEEREARRKAMEEAYQQELEQRRQYQEMERARRLRNLKRQHPRNQQLWREVAVLMTAISKLEKEEKAWIELEQEIAAREQQQVEQEVPIQQGEQVRQVSLPADGNQTPDDSVTKTEYSTTGDIEDVVDVPKHELQIQVERALHDIAVSSTRIQDGLKIVKSIVSDADAVRTELYEKYRQDHQFRGYQAIKDPKGMIRFLSQDDE